MGEEIGDDRARAYGRSLEGWALAKLGEYQGAEENFIESFGYFDACGEIQTKLVATSRLAFVTVQDGSGRLDDAVDKTSHCLARAVERKLVLPNFSLEGSFLAAAGLLWKRDGRLSRDYRQQVARTRRSTMGPRMRRATAGLFHAGVGACDIAAGDLPRGKAAIARGLAIAEGYGFWGEVRDVHAVAALALPEGDPDRDEHDKRCRELMEDFKARRRTSK